jgi:VWFA-related protein
MRESTVRPVAWFFTFAWATAWGFAQTGPGTGQPEQQVLRVTTRLVVVNVVVHDKKGAAVEGLTRDDFTVFDDGKEEKISFFSVERRGAMHGPSEPLSPNVFSNRMARQGGIPTSVAAILLDESEECFSKTVFQDSAYARQELIKLLSQLQPQELIALYVYGRRLRVIQDFTSDPSPLIEALRQSGNPTARASDTSMQPEAREMPLQGLSGPSAVAASQLSARMFDLANACSPGYWRREEIFDVLEAIANHLSGLPGRKTLIWLTDATAVPCPSCTPLREKIRGSIQSMNEADVAVFPVDSRGLFANPDFLATNKERVAYERGFRGGLDAMTVQIHGMIDWAQQTGGRAFYNTNDLRSAIRTALNYSEITYTLGYYPSHCQWDGQFRAIKVPVNMPGVEVRHRQGYFASPATVKSVKTKDRMVMLKDAALNPLQASGVGVTVRVTRFKGPTGAHKLEIDVSPDLNDLTFQQVNGRWTGLFDVLVGQYSKQDKSLRGITKTVAENLTNATYQEIMRKGLTITYYQDVARRAEELRVVVRDGLSGSTGSVKIPLHQQLQGPPALSPRPQGSPSDIWRKGRVESLR